MHTTTTRPRQPNILALGDAAVLVEFADHLDLATNTRIQVLAHAIRSRAVPWVRDVVPALASLAVHVDPVLLGFGDATEPVRQLVASCIDDTLATQPRPQHVVRVPICYDAEFGLDLNDISERTGLGVAEVIQRHLQSDFRVLMVGFAPGHPYLGGLDPGLSVPRRSAPRVRMPCGAVAIANTQCVVYPFEIPGGWSVVGQTPLRVFDAKRSRPSLFEPNDQVHFERIDRREFDAVACTEGAL